MKIKEFHLFAGIGGGIYGGKLLGHECCGAVEIDTNCQKVLQQRQTDGWLENFPIYGDLTQLPGQLFKGSFDVLCGGFPCQAFSHAAHGKNIAEKNLWGEMFRFVQESDAPIVFGENVTEKAIIKAASDLESIGYKIRICKLSCGELGGDHQRNRFWILGVKNFKIFEQLKTQLSNLPKLKANSWIKEYNNSNPIDESERRVRLKGIGNAQSPFVAATAFRILVNRFDIETNSMKQTVSTEELSAVFQKQTSWIQKTFNCGFVHTPTTMANYCCASMMKHKGCRNFKMIFKQPTAENEEYLMGFPFGATSFKPVNIHNFIEWLFC